MLSTARILARGFSRWGFSRLTTSLEETYWRIRRPISIVAAGKIAAGVRHAVDSVDPPPGDAAFGGSQAFPIVPWLAEESDMAVTIAMGAPMANA